jgi:Arc/MetJ family transcription regulator
MKAEYDLSAAVRGPVVPTPPGYTRITIRIDDEVLDWFRDKVHRAGGGNHQRLMNDALREYIEQRESIEEMFRRVVREELGRLRASGNSPRGRWRTIGALRRLAPSADDRSFGRRRTTVRDRGAAPRRRSG